MEAGYCRGPGCSTADGDDYAQFVAIYSPSLLGQISSYTFCHRSM